MRGPTHIARFRDVDIVRHARIVGNDVEKAIAPLQRADELGSTAFQDADHRSGLLGGRRGLQSPLGHVASNEHAILVQRRRGGVFGNGDLLERGIIGLKKSFAAAIDPNSTRDEVRLVGQDITIALDPCDLPGLFKFAQSLLQVLLAVGRQTEAHQQFRNVCGNVILLRQ